MAEHDFSGKSAPLAALFNFISWGTGYAYAGIRNIRGIPWVMGTLAQAIILVIQALAPLVYYDYWTWTYQINYGALLIAVISLLVSAFLARDVYRKCRPKTSAVPTLVSGPLKCPNCSSPVSSSDEFCPECGKKLAIPKAAVTAAGSTPGKRCNECGTYNPDVYSFCQRCGSKLS